MFHHLHYSLSLLEAEKVMKEYGPCEQTLLHDTFFECPSFNTGKQVWLRKRINLDESEPNVSFVLTTTLNITFGTTVCFRECFGDAEIRKELKTTREVPLDELYAPRTRFRFYRQSMKTSFGTLRLDEIAAGFILTVRTTTRQEFQDARESFKDFRVSDSKLMTVWASRPVSCHLGGFRGDVLECSDDELSNDFYRNAKYPFADIEATDLSLETLQKVAMEGLLQESFNRLVSQHLSKQYTGPIEATTRFIGDFPDALLFSIILMIEKEIDFKQLQISCRDTDDFLVIDRDLEPLGEAKKLGLRFLMAVQKEPKTKIND